MMAAILTSSVQFPSSDAGVTLTATLYEPAAQSTPVPAVVVLHTCAGIDGTLLDWGEWLAQNGYAALVVDSFGPRRVGSVCGTHDVPGSVRALDAYGALAYLRTRSEIDGEHIGEIGFSHGGGAILWTEDQGTASRAGMSGHGFRAAIAFYPSTCAQRPARSLTVPLLLLIGADDDWTDANTCVRYIDSIDPAGASSVVHVYPGAYHKFDDPQAHRIAHVGRNTYTLQYDAKAAEDAHARVLLFFAQYL